MIKFYKVTQAQYDALTEPETDAIYFTTDTRQLYAGGKNYTHGITGEGHIIGGYTIPVFGYEESSNVYTLLLSSESEAVDFTKFTVGEKLELSLVRETTSEGSETEYSYVEAEIASIDAANFRITLTESLYGGNINSNTKIGLEKITCSGYTDKASGGPSVYRVTLASTPSELELFTGRKIYTRAGTGNLTPNTVAGVSGNYLYLSSAAAGTTAVYFGNPNLFLTDADSDGSKNEFASGSYNFISGESATADGGWNTVIGVTASSLGNSNTVVGSMSNAIGSTNFVAGDTSFALGASNEIHDSSSIAIGNGNKLYYQTEYAIGVGNEISGISSFAIGNMNRITSYGNIVLGQNNKISGKYSFALGYSNKIEAQNAYVIGRYADVPDLTENKNAVIFYGGEINDAAEAFSVRCFKTGLNSRYDPNLDPSDTGTDSNNEEKYVPQVAYSTQYKGHLLPVTEIITLDLEEPSAIKMDHDRYARWEVSGTGSIEFSVQNWIDGDRGELLVNTETQSVSFPADWSLPDSFDITTSPGVYLLEIRKENDQIYMHQLLPYKE